MSCADIDWKLGKPGTILGADFSGIVVKTGKNVTNGPKIGDHVAGVAHANAYPDKGAYAEYVKADPELVWVVPENTFSLEQAAAYGVAHVYVPHSVGYERITDMLFDSFWTAVQALYNPKHLGLVEPPEKVSEPQWVLIYGGSSECLYVAIIRSSNCSSRTMTHSAACGLSAIQLAHLSGYKVVTTASVRNHERLKSIGADVTIDYREPDLVSKIKQATGDSVKYGADMIGEEETKKVIVQAIGPSGGKVVGLNPLQGEESGRQDVTFNSACQQSFSFASSY